MALALEVRHLQLVDAIADTGTVTAAAMRLHLTQSALSHQLREIESRLDVKLFDRLGRKMVLTPAGSRIRASARSVLQDLDVARPHPWASRGWIKPAEFATEHLIIYSADRAGSFTFRYILGPAGVEPARVSEVPLTEAILELVKAGLGVSVVARWAVKPAVRAGEIAAVRITKAGVFRPWTAVTRRRRTDKPWVRDFIELLAQDGLPARDLAPVPSRKTG